MEKKFILFDFDGVIVDSYRVAYESRLVICPHVTEENHKSRFEGNIFAYEDNEHTPECRLELDFFEVYAPKMEKAILFPGVKEVVEELAKKYSLIIISSTAREVIEKVLKRNNLEGAFAEIMSFETHKSKEKKIEMVFEKYNTTPEHCIFITDTLGDIREAKKMEVESIAVAWGFHSKETLQKGDPYALIDSPKELRRAIEEFFAIAPVQ